MEYNYDIKSNEKIDWDTNYTAAFYLEPLSQSYESSVEYYSYDTGDLMGDVGGYLGLFLGWSLLSITETLPFLLHKLSSILIRLNS